MVRHLECICMAKDKKEGQLLLAQQPLQLLKIVETDNKDAKSKAEDIDAIFADMNDCRKKEDSVARQES